MADRLYICGSCDHPFAESEGGGPVRECSRCGQTLTGEEAGRCPECNIFTAKVADESCPECEAPEEELQAVNEQTYKDALARVAKEAEEREERRKNPPPKQQWEIDMEIREQKAKAPWMGPEPLGRCLYDIPKDGGHVWNKDNNLGLQWELFFAEGSRGISIEREEAAAICEKILRLERELQEARS